MADRYLVATNIKSLTNCVSVDSLNNAKKLNYGGVIVVEAKIRIGQGHCANASIFEVHMEHSAAVYSNFYLDALGNLFVVDANGNKSNKIQLNANDWVSIKVILDTVNNLKDVYINDEIVVRGDKLSNEINTSEFVVDFTRLVNIMPDSEATIGCVQFDDYSFRPYFDSLYSVE